MFTFSESDLSYDLAYQAHYGTSHTPEIRARQEIQGYINHMTYARDTFAQWETDENRAAMAEDLERYKAGYLRRLTAKLQADSRTLSVLVTGGARFPARRNEKACQVAHNRLEDLLAYQEKVLARLERKYNPVKIARAPVMSDDADAVAKLQAKIDEAQKWQDHMRAANRIVRKKDLTGEEKVKRLAELGMAEGDAWRLFDPDYMGRVGYADYQLSNNNANIRRMKQRIEDLKKEQEREPAGDLELEGVTLVENTDIGRVQLLFEDKPPADVRETLKRRFGFRWAPSQGAWQRHLNGNGRAAAALFLDWYKGRK